MGETDKPFACTNESCQMTFTNEDHLNVHRKKHDMVLNLGLTCKSSVTAADQTPTPTRFIRNCEEVGLFQDLQNVNPFEETFRKAFEHSKTGIMHIPDSPNDDSLHTPQIFHHISENSINKLPLSPDRHYNKSAVDNNLLKIDSKDSSIREDCLSPVESSIDIKENHFSYSTELSTSNEKEYDLSSSNSNDGVVENLSIVKKNLNNYLLKSNKHGTKSDVKEKIKEALHNKRKSEMKPLDLKIKDDFSIVKKPRQRISLKSKLKATTDADPEASDADNVQCLDFYDKKLSEVEKRRAMNRKAQMRSRKRKKMWLDQMEQEIDKLKMDNKLIVMENQKLKEENILLKSMLLKHENCSLADLNIQNGTVPMEPSSDKKLVAIQPKPLLYNTYTIRSSQSNLKLSQTSSNIKLTSSPFSQKLLPKLLPKGTVSAHQSSNDNCSESVLPEHRKIHLNNEEVLNLTSMKIPQTIVLQVKTTKSKI